jgi:predicted amidohydrolase
LRTRSTTWSRAGLAALAAALSLIPAAASEARTVRVFAMNPKLDLAWLESRDGYRAKLLALSDKSLRGGGAPRIQDGADDVASHRLGPTDPDRPVETARDLVVWPEDLGLFAALTGPRAAPARSSGSLEGAILTLIGLYAPQNEYYGQKYPNVVDRVPQVRLLTLALTDTFGRAVIETAAEMASRHRVWLEIGVNMAQDWQVVCADRDAFNAASPARLPGGQLCQEENSQKVQQLRDPFEPGRDYAYEAVTSRSANMALLFDPAGRLVSRQLKQYLTEFEVPGLLDLVPGEVSGGLSAVRTPVGTLGFVTSKDSWMPDVQAKLDQAHVDLLVQPEFFVDNTVGTEGMWSPDILLASGYSNVLRHPSIETMVMPEATGAVFNFDADAQTHFAVKPRTSGANTGFMVGQPAAPGLAAVAPWVVPDPARAGEPFAERRKRLGEAGRALAPGSGVACADPGKAAPCENGHWEGVLRRDVEVDRRPGYRRYRGSVQSTRFSAAHPVAPSKNAQRNAAMAVHGSRVLLAYEERRGGRDQILVVRSSDSGRSWSKPVRPTGRPAGTLDEWWPAVALGPEGQATIAWVDRSTDRERVHFAQSSDGGRRWGSPKPLDASPPRGVAQWRPALAHGRGDVVHAAFVDEREVSADDALPQAHLFYARVRGGQPEAARRLDQGDPAPLAARSDNSWAPRVSVRGDRVLVTWLDFLRYDWDVFTRESTDAGAKFADQRDVNDTPAADEALNDSPDAALGGSKPLVAWTDWRKRDSAATQPHEQYDVFVASPGAKNVQADRHGTRPVSTFAPSICASRGDDAIVAYQDASRGQNDVYAVHLRGGTKRGAPRRVDDAGDRGGNAWRPRLGCWGNRVIAAWEDERDGPAQVYAATSSVRRLR